jgi:RNA polymerase sigma factor (sigma-70 family)
MSKELRVTVRVKNNRLIEAREVLGLSAREAADRMGLQYETLLNYEGLRLDPRQKRRSHSGVTTVTGALRKSAQKIVDFYGLDWKIVWPEHVLSIVEPIRSAKVDAAEWGLRRISSPTAVLSLPADTDLEREFLDRERSESVNRYMDVLNPRELQVLSMRFGLNNEEERTYAEIGEQFNLTRERTRQICENALAKIRRQMD